QAEDGIRDGHVTGVQTCALPISSGYAASLDSKSRKVHCTFRSSTSYLWQAGMTGCSESFGATRSIFLTRSSLTVGPTASSTNLILNLFMSVTVVRTQGRTTERLESSK